MPAASKAVSSNARQRLDMEEMDCSIETTINTSSGTDPEIWSLIQSIVPQTPTATAQVHSTLAPQIDLNAWIDAGCPDSKDVEEITSPLPTTATSAGGDPVFDNGAGPVDPPTHGDNDDKDKTPLYLDGPPRQVFEQAFGMMIEQLLGLPNIAVAGTSMDRTGRFALDSPAWYTDGVIDTVCRIVIRDSGDTDIFYQDATDIEIHLPRVGKGNSQDCKSRRKSLLDWYSNLRASAIQTPGVRWPCPRMARDCSSVVFPWSPFNNHWVAVQILKEGRIMLWNSLQTLGPAISEYAQRVLPLYAQLISLDPANDWDL
jgi:hypothetical protein